MSTHFATGSQTNLLSGQIAADVEPDLESGRAVNTDSKQNANNATSAAGGQMSAAQKEQSIWEQSATCPDASLLAFGSGIKLMMMGPDRDAKRKWASGMAASSVLGQFGGVGGTIVSGLLRSGASKMFG
ncbi:Golgi apparatus membrane protein tvp23 [Cystobasidiomycetes sp. EMM_F5]